MDKVSKHFNGVSPRVMERLGWMCLWIFCFPGVGIRRDCGSYLEQFGPNLKTVMNFLLKLWIQRPWRYVFIHLSICSCTTYWDPGACGVRVNGLTFQFELFAWYGKQSIAEQVLFPQFQSPWSSSSVLTFLGFNSSSISSLFYKDIVISRIKNLVTFWGVL